MRYFPVRCNSRVVIYERNMFIRLATNENSSTDGRKTFYFFANLLVVKTVVLRVKTRLM